MHYMCYHHWSLAMYLQWFNIHRHDWVLLPELPIPHASCGFGFRRRDSAGALGGNLITVFGCNSCSRRPSRRHCSIRLLLLLVAGSIVKIKYISVASRAVFHLRKLDICPCIDKLKASRSGTVSVESYELINRLRLYMYMFVVVIR